MEQSACVLERRPYEPFVVKQEGQLIYNLPVERGFASLCFSFEITPEHLAVLCSDDDRYYLLFAVLHCKYQSLQPKEAPRIDASFDRILFGQDAEVQRILASQDRVNHGAVTNFFRLKTGRMWKAH